MWLGSIKVIVPCEYFEKFSKLFDLCGQAQTQAY